jgi:uncharacterized HAD superfamily protein
LEGKGRVISVDMDNTLCAAMKHMYEWMNEWFGKVSPDIGTTFDYNGKLLIETDILKVHRFLNEFNTEAEAMKNKIYEGAKSAMDWIYENYEVHIVTSRHPRWEDVTKRWLKENGIKYDKLEIGAVAKNHCDLLIDDNPDMIWNALGHGKKVIIFMQPWNAIMKNIQLDPKQCRIAGSWLFIPKMIREMLG